MGDVKFWLVYSSDTDRHAPVKAASEEEADRVASKLATANPGTHFYILEGQKVYKGLVEVEESILPMHPFDRD